MAEISDVYNKLLHKEGLLDIDSFKGTKELHVMNFEIIMFQYFLALRRAVRFSNFGELGNIIRAMQITVFNYLTQEEQDILNKIDIKTNIKIHALGRISDPSLRRQIECLVLFKGTLEKLEQLNLAMYKNNIFYNTDAFLALVTNHYASMSQSVNSPMIYIFDILYLKSLCYPFMRTEELVLVNDNFDIGLNLMENWSSRGNRTKGVQVLTSYAFQILHTLVKVLNARGILFEKNIDIDLSLVDFSRSPISIKEKMSHLFIRDIWHRTHKENRNWLAVMVGQTGSGKSYSALSLAKLLDPTFSAKRVAFNFKHFMDIVSELAGKGTQGEAIIWDETGIDLDSRKFYSTVNILANKILQTFRSDRFNVIFTVPDASFVDTRTRKLFHHVIETKTILRDSGRCVTTWYESHRSASADKERMWHPRLVFEGKRHVLKDILIPKPPQDIIKEYEELKSEFNKNLKEFVQGEIEDVKAIQPKKSMDDLRDLMKRVIEGGELNVFSSVRAGRRSFNTDMLQMRFELSKNDSKKLKMMLEDLTNS